MKSPSFETCLIVLLKISLKRLTTLPIYRKTVISYLSLNTIENCINLYTENQKYLENRAENVISSFEDKVNAAELNKVESHNKE